MNKDNNNTYTVESLRKSGYKVRVIHFRHNSTKTDNKYYINYPPELITELVSIKRSKENQKQGCPIYPRGGLTKVEITTPDGKDYHSFAECSIKDNFNRRRGIKICIDRIFKTLNA